MSVKHCLILCFVFLRQTTYLIDQQLSVNNCLIRMSCISTSFKHVFHRSTNERDKLLAGLLFQRSVTGKLYSLVSREGQDFDCEEDEFERCEGEYSYLLTAANCLDERCRCTSSIYGGILGVFGKVGSYSIDSVRKTLTVMFN